MFRQGGLSSRGRRGRAVGRGLLYTPTESVFFLSQQSSFFFRESDFIQEVSLLGAAVAARLAEAERRLAEEAEDNETLRRVQFFKPPVRLGGAGKERVAEHPLAPIRTRRGRKRDAGLGSAFVCGKQSAC